MRPQFEAMGATVLAINPASVTRHKKWADKMGFGFPILSDPDGTTAAAFGCRKSPRGGVLRTVYAIDPEGKIIFAERGHAELEQVKATISALRKR
jgi:peroxiredoxin Q/BCP